MSVPSTVNTLLEKRHLGTFGAVRDWQLSSRRERLQLFHISLLIIKRPVPRTRDEITHLPTYARLHQTNYPLQIFISNSRDRFVSNDSPVRLSYLKHLLHVKETRLQKRCRNGIKIRWRNGWKPFFFIKYIPVFTCLNLAAGIGSCTRCLWNHPVKEPTARVPASTSKEPHSTTNKRLWVDSTIAMITTKINKHLPKTFQHFSTLV